MNSLRIKPTKFILCRVLSSCLKAPDIFLGLQVHAHVIQAGYEANQVWETGDAWRAFNGLGEHDLVSWTSIISGFAQNGRGWEALLLLKEMFKADVRPSSHTFASIISACKRLEEAYEEGQSLHAQVIKSGFEPNSFVISSLIDFYSKHGEIEQALSLFDLSSEKDTILYNSIISGFSQNMLKEEALKLFLEMQEKEMKPTGFTLASLLNTSWDMNMAVSGSLVDMYSKCGIIDEARRAFDCAPERNSIMWTSMITGYAQNGRGLDSLQLFEKLVEEGGEPDHICFTAILTACNHGGFLDKGIHYFELMTSEYGLVPELDQYACMVDLYGRTGRLREAKELMETITLEPNAVLWSSFLTGKEAAMKLYELEPKSSAPYITLASAFAVVGMWDEVAEVRGMWKQKGVKKSAGWSWLEVGNMVHLFLVGDKSHTESREIYSTLNLMTLQMKEGFWHLDEHLL
ncbi:unnamed protein product [Spirodela intermedia]|uniref:Uncharacterized protein n=1 Tax=Spirodela intermedia TaxID=51605 RepID=A0A7I8ITY7_SPIIN|nr:unnamed protein product [Spirodela intermedia]CAA6660415.1 unnamed protein product [Spirodela intermedia]